MMTSGFGSPARPRQRRSRTAGGDRESARVTVRGRTSWARELGALGRRAGRAKKVPPGCRATLSGLLASHRDFVLGLAQS
jgi:hypothetical protein